MEIVGGSLKEMLNVSMFRHKLEQYSCDIGQSIVLIQDHSIITLLSVLIPRLLP